MSTGSGVEHAEGGASPKGEILQGFQIWINVPANRKMDAPRCGTVPPDELVPTCDLGPASRGVTARVLAGTAFGQTGAFATLQPVQLTDFELEAGALLAFQVAGGMDTVILYVYEGTIESLNKGQAEDPIPPGHVVLLDASSPEHRRVELTTAERGAKVLYFGGQKLREPVAWHGSIVMNTNSQLQQAFRELRAGKFPPVRVDWDYKRIASKPSPSPSSQRKSRCCNWGRIDDEL